MFASTGSRVVSRLRRAQICCGNSKKIYRIRQKQHLEVRILAPSQPVLLSRDLWGRPRNWLQFREL